MPGRGPGECGTAYSRTRCLPSPKEIPLRYVPACGEDCARSIPSGSPHKAKVRLCGGPGEAGIRLNGAFLRCPHSALPRYCGGLGCTHSCTVGHTGVNAVFQGLGGVPSSPGPREGYRGPQNAKHGVMHLTGVGRGRFPVPAAPTAADGAPPKHLGTGRRYRAGCHFALRPLWW